jgi:hypothetical protein
MTSFLLNNRQRQKKLETYKTKSEIDEALSLFKKHFSPAAYKVFKFILHTNGVTQAKYSTMSEKIGYSESYFHRKIIKEINEKLGEKILKTIPTQKFDHSGLKKARGSSFKILPPLAKLKYLIEKYEKKKDSELQADLEDFCSIPGVESSVENSVESDAEIPSRSKTEDSFFEEQKESFRENLSENPYKELNINPLFIDKNFGKIKIKNAVKNYLNNFPLFRDFMSWSESKRYEIAKTIQLAIIKTDTDIEEPKPQHMIRKAINRFMSEYANKPKSEFLRLLYTFVSNALKIDQEDESERPEDHSDERPSQEPTLQSPAAEYNAAFPSRQSLAWEEIKPTYYRLQEEKRNKQRDVEKEKAEIDRMMRKLYPEDYDEPATKEELDAQGVY